MNKLFISSLAALSFCAASYATILHVPTEYATIQAALNVVQDSDTVLVASGTYGEALVTPDVSFALLGESAVDSLRPVVDPSTLPDPTTTSCLVWNGPNCQIENFVFRNRSAMYPRPVTTDGGVILNAIAASFRNCTFDSTNAGLYVSGFMLLTMGSCQFVDCPGATVAGEWARIVAENCYFENYGMRPDSGSVFSHCTFDSLRKYAMIPLGDLLLESCIFQNGNSPNWPMIDAGYVNPTVRNCIFRNSIVAHSVFFISRNCSRDMLIENNLFENVTSTAEDYGRAGLLWSCSSSNGPSVVTIRGNTFVNCSAPGAGKCVQSPSNDLSTVYLDHNRFINIEGDGPTLAMHSGYVIARDNIFINTNFALSTDGFCDARYNYWGDPTGPYNAINNPHGLGDEVSDSVLVFPWYEDSLFSAVPPLELPRDFSFSVYPNPFNSTTRIALDAPGSFIASIELINILGQRVREIHHGPVLGHQEFLIDANSLPSGIYFVNIGDALKNSVFSTQKIVLLK